MVPDLWPGATPASPEFSVLLEAYNDAWTMYVELGDNFADHELNAVGEMVTPLEDAVLEAPAPDWHALVAKLEIVWRDNRPFMEEDLIAVILADARRLAGRT
jgi:hypothetical protein